MQNQLDVITTRMEEAEEWIPDLEDKIMENNEPEKKRGRKVFDHKCRFRKLSDSIKHNYIHIIGVLQQEEREKEAEDIFEQIIDGNFPNLGKEADIQIQEA